MPCCNWNGGKSFNLLKGGRKSGISPSGIQIQKVGFAGIQIQKVLFAGIQIQKVDFAGIQIQKVDFAGIQHGQIHASPPVVRVASASYMEGRD